MCPEFVGHRNVPTLIALLMFPNSNYQAFVQFLIHYHPGGLGGLVEVVGSVGLSWAGSIVVVVVVVGVGSLLL
jgi:hypothetical protein